MVNLIPFLTNLLMSHSGIQVVVPNGSDDGTVSIPLDLVQSPGNMDPLALSASRVGPSELERLAKTGPKGRVLSGFYQEQNELIETLLRPADYVEDGEVERLFKLKVAVYGSAVVNLFLFALQLVAAILSRSLALFATCADSFMDLSSSVVLVYTTHLAAQSNYLKYPTGKARFETAGIIVFATLMSTLSIELVVESARVLAGGEGSVGQSALTLSLVGTAIFAKVGLYFYCVALSRYPSAAILAQDHRNDIMFNTLGIALSLLGQYVKWWLDPVGAILIACFILRSWSSTAQEHILLLVGKSADATFLKRITYLAMTHDSRILMVDTCKAYHSGSNYFVEVDIVLPPDMPLKEAHDVGESLQVKIETVPEVERAFVHLDYEVSHAPEHQKSKSI